MASDTQSPGDLIRAASSSGSRRSSNPMSAPATPPNAPKTNPAVNTALFGRPCQRRPGLGQNLARGSRTGAQRVEEVAVAIAQRQLSYLIRVRLQNRAYRRPGNAGFRRNGRNSAEMAARVTPG